MVINKKVKQENYACLAMLQSWHRLLAEVSALAIIGHLIKVMPSKAAKSWDTPQKSKIGTFTDFFDLHPADSIPRVLTELRVRFW
jgi:hypothetical protein